MTWWLRRFLQYRPVRVSTARPLRDGEGASLRCSLGCVRIFFELVMLEFKVLVVVGRRIAVVDTPHELDKGTAHPSTTHWYPIVTIVPCVLR